MEKRKLKMKALSKEEINHICSLYETYGNVRKVSYASSKSIGVVHKYLSKHELIKKQNTVNRISNDDERLVGTYVGLWLGDGTQYIDRHRFTIKICSNKRDVLLNKFIQELIFRIFGKKTSLIKEKNSNRAYIKFHSKFIFNFIKSYARHSGIKTYSVSLRKDVDDYRTKFLEGCLLGLTLSDGYLKKNFAFSTASQDLGFNVFQILKIFGYNPYLNTQKRINKADSFKVSLSSSQSLRLSKFLDNIIISLGFNYSFQELKYGPGVI